jgi:hypothetical protein
MLASTTCPRPDLDLSNSAIIIPRAQSKPPPPKSAARLTGAVGFSVLRPRSDNNPKAIKKNYQKFCMKLSSHFLLHDIYNM